MVKKSSLCELCPQYFVGNFTVNVVENIIFATLLFNKTGTDLMTTPIDYLPILLQFVFVAVFIAGMIALSHYVGPKRGSRNKDASFECGVKQYGNARIPFSVKYFLVAILFVLFDVEVIFLYPWAVNFREMGFDGFWKMLMFMGLLLIGFFYVIKKGALDWE